MTRLAFKKLPRHEVLKFPDEADRAFPLVFNVFGFS
jgi:hypothetical protein